MCAKPLEYKVAQWQSRAKITEVQWLQSGRDW
jgi:hypothetical protein